MGFEQRYNVFRARSEEHLKRYFHDGIKECNTLTDSVKYSLFAGGKRLRSVLMYSVAEFIGGLDNHTVDVFAAALEMIHTSSLIHDDLPAMDDDALRRGHPTNHKVYGEGVALLAGDTLMFKGFEITAECAYKCPSKGPLKALWMLGRQTGYQGMTGGQIIDMELSPNQACINELFLMHSKKTGALIDFAVKAPIYISETEDLYEADFSAYSSALGQAFQIKDDILDFESTAEVLGKNTSDARNDKSTYVTVLGIDTAKEKLLHCYNEACNALKPYGSKADFLLDLADFVKNRKR